MLVNFTNLNMSDDIEDFIKGEEPGERKFGHMMCVVRSFLLRKANYSKKLEGWIVVIDAAHGPDPKVHFDTLEKAESFYKFLCSHFGENTHYLDVNVLDHGAI